MTDASWAPRFVSLRSLNERYCWSLSEDRSDETKRAPLFWSLSEERSDESKRAEHGRPR